jgi:hypothetical protein
MAKLIQEPASQCQAGVNESFDRAEDVTADKSGGFARHRRQDHLKDLKAMKASGAPRPNADTNCSLDPVRDPPVSSHQAGGKFMCGKSDTSSRQPPSRKQACQTPFFAFPVFKIACVNGNVAGSAIRQCSDTGKDFAFQKLQGCATAG